TILTFLFLLIGVVPLLVVGIFSYINLNNNAESLVFYSLGLFTEMANSRLLDYFDGIEKEGQVIAATQDIYQNMKVLEEAGWDRNDPAWKKNAAILDDFLSTAVSKLGLAKVILTDPAGKVAYDTGKEMIGSSLAQRDYVQAALKGSRYWSPLFFSDILNENCLIYALPVYSEGQSGHIVGTISIMLNDHIIGQVIREGLEETGMESADAYLIDGQGLLLTNTCFGEYTADASLQETIDTEAVELLSAAVEAGDFEFSTQVKYKDYLGEAVLGTLHVTRLGDNPVGFVVEVNQAEVFKDVYKMRNLIILFGLLLVAGIFAVSRWQAQAIAGPLHEIAGVAEEIARGNLTVETEVKRDDEIGQLSKAFNRMSLELRALIGQVVDLATGVNSGTEAVSAASEEMSSSLQEVSATINEFAGNVQQLSRGAQEAAEANEDIMKRAEEGRAIIEKAVEHMEIISKRVQDLQEVISRVDQRSHDIGQILTVITDIADQTNLLALNAAIEAARAGEQGRGFAVVAEEVRKLAEQSASAAEEIGELIRDTQQESKQALESMNLGVKEVQEGAEVVAEAGSSFKEIIHGVEEIGVRVEETASAAEELSASSEELAASAQEQSSTMEEIAASAEELRAAAERMFDEVGKFRYQ
ncbi:MAG: methyl-accepting chemotaxis protein, partial [Dethiobacteria bacterium]